jgi:hypothetical protein
MPAENWDFHPSANYKSTKRSGMEWEKLKD